MTSFIVSAPLRFLRLKIQIVSVLPGIFSMFPVCSVFPPFSDDTS